MALNFEFSGLFVMHSFAFYFILLNVVAVYFYCFYLVFYYMKQYQKIIK